MKILKSLSFLCLLAILISACNQPPCGINKKYFLTNYEAFVDEIKDKDLAYNDEAWVKLDKKFNQFKDVCFENFKDKMTEDEKEAFYANSAKYVWLRYGSGFVNQILDKDSEVVDKFLDNLKDAWDGTENEMDKVIDELREEVDKIDKEKLEDLLRDIGGDMEDWGKKIEDIFKDVEIEINEK